MGLVYSFHQFKSFLYLWMRIKINRRALVSQKLENSSTDLVFILFYSFKYRVGLGINKMRKTQSNN